MKRFLLLCLIGMAALDTRAAMGDAHQPVEAFSAVIWTTTTLIRPTGKPSTFMQRTVYTRDASGNMRREVYQSTEGFLHNTTAPLERVLTSSTSAESLPHVHSSKETVEQETDLGTLLFSGLPATGNRQTFKDANGQRTHMLETWFSPTLGLTVHMENSNARGDSVVSDLSDLHLGKPPSSSAGIALVSSPPIPMLNLYRGLFTLVAHMERDRQENDPNRHVNMDEIEGHLRRKMSLSPTEWQTLVDKSVKLEGYTREMTKQARNFADQDRAARKQNPSSGNTLVAGHATLHKMQLDLNSHVQEEIDQLKTTVGPDATTHIEAYLQGPLVASTSRISFTPSLRSQKEQAR